MRRPSTGATGANKSSSADQVHFVEPVEMTPTATALPGHHRPRNGHHGAVTSRGIRGARPDLPAAGPTPQEQAEELEALRGTRRSGLSRLRTSGEQAQERRIAKRLAAGDPQGLQELHDLTARAAFSVILGIVRDRGHAEDVHQQTFAELWRRAEQFDPSRGTLLSWVLTIARSRALDHVRRRSDQPTDADVLAAIGGAEEDRAYQDVLDRALIGEALARIPAQERELLRMRFWEGLSQTEIAERTGQPLGTVKSRMLAGLRNMKLHLESESVA